MFARIFGRLEVWLHRSKPHVPVTLEMRITSLRSQVRRGGRGSDLAAAELRGIMETVMAVCR